MTRNVQYRWPCPVLVIAILLLTATWARAEAPRRIIILVPEHKAYQAAARACETVLKEKGQSPKVINLTDGPASVVVSCRSCHSFAAPASAPTASSADSSRSPGFGPSSRPASTEPDSLVITLGDQATLGILKECPKSPVVFGMISNVLDAPAITTNEYKQRVAGVTTDMNPADQLKWLRRLNPGLQNICVPHSDRSIRTAQSFKTAGTELGLTVSLIETYKDDFTRTVDDLTNRRCDAVLMIADADIYNPVSIKRLLVWGIRQKRPVWAFSENFVKAGALGCLSIDPENIGRQTASVALRLVKGTKPAKIGIVYPEQVKVSFNERTAKLIELSPPSGSLEGVTIWGREE